MSVEELLRWQALGGIPLGLLFGLLLGPVANRPDGWGGYGSLRRRAARLAHVASVMLPALAGLYAVLLPRGAYDGRAAAAAAWMWGGGGAALVAVLWATALRPAWRLALPLPALTLLAAAALFLWAAAGGT